MDGVIRFPLPGKSKVGKVLISVKGGKAVAPTAACDLVGTVKMQDAEMGLLITMVEPSKGVKDAVSHAGTYTWPLNNETFPKAQVITVRELLSGKKPNLPPSLTPYLQASKTEASSGQLTLGA